MGAIFNKNDRMDTFEYVLASAKDCDRIVSLIQVGSGAVGYHDDKSDLDFVAALDAEESMIEAMNYMHRVISDKYELLFFKQVEETHLQVYLLSNMLEIDIGFGGYEHAAARKPAFKVLYDRTGVVEEKMIKSMEWMNQTKYGDKRENDIAVAGNTAWARLMHAAVAIKRGNYFRVIGEMEYVRKLYINLLGNRYFKESVLNKEIDDLPEEEKEKIKSTLVLNDSSDALWSSLLNLTKLIYDEMEGNEHPVSYEKLLEYYRDIQ